MVHNQNWTFFFSLDKCWTDNQTKMFLFLFQLPFKVSCVQVSYNEKFNVVRSQSQTILFEKFVVRLFQQQGFFLTERNSQFRTIKFYDPKTPTVAELFCPLNWHTGDAGFNLRTRLTTQPFGFFRCFRQNSRKSGLGSLRKTLHEGHSPLILESQSNQLDLHLQSNLIRDLKTQNATYSKTIVLFYNFFGTFF